MNYKKIAIASVLMLLTPALASCTRNPERPRADVVKDIAMYKAEIEACKANNKTGGIQRNCGRPLLSGLYSTLERIDAKEHCTYKDGTMNETFFGKYDPSIETNIKVCSKQAPKTK